MEPVLILTHGDISALQGAIDKLKEEGFEATALNTSTATFTDILAGLAGNGNESEEKDEEEKDNEEDGGDKGDEPADDAAVSPDAELEDTPPAEEEVPEGAVVHGELVALRVFEGYGIELHTPNIRSSVSGATHYTDITINESILRSWSAQDSAHQMLVSLKGGKSLMTAVNVVGDTGSSTYLRVGRETMKLF